MGKRNLEKTHYQSRVVHSGRIKPDKVDPHVVPIYQTVNFEYDDFDHQLRVGQEKESGYFYTRYGNPTIDSLNSAMTDLEGGDCAFSFASGMAAISAAIMGSVKPGDHILASSVLYGGAYNLLANHLNTWNVETSFVDVWDLDAVEHAFRENTKLIYLEPVMNPTVAVADMPELIQMAKNHGVKVAVDNTFTPPYLYHPIHQGADVVIHSTTKFIAGHGDTIGGIVVGSDESMKNIITAGRVFGGVMSPMNAWLTLRGIRTLGIRLEKSCQNAMAVAQFLDSHHSVLKVNYPGLGNHPQHKLAEKQFNGFGSMLSFEILGGLNAVRTICDAFQMITATVSLGEVDTIASHPASSSHVHMEQSHREKYGIADGLIRFSVGIEHADDIINDVSQALNRVS